jgi:tripartite-type tricarboxylate transporter receptor subunit TctC
MIGIKMTFVPYRSGLEGLTGLIRGDIQVLLDLPAVMVPQVKAEPIPYALETDWPVGGGGISPVYGISR